MKKGITVILIIVGLINNIHSQSELDTTQIRNELDNILLEADVLYRYEKAAWNALDLAKLIPAINQTFNDYLVYSIGDSIKVIIVNKNNKCIYNLTFFDDFDKPLMNDIKTRELTPLENEYLIAKNKIISKLTKPKYKVSWQEGFGLNFILLPFEKGYKLYIITGTSQSNMIPFGNDYLFVANKKGKIKSWRKFHTRLIPVQTDMGNGRKVIKSSHSHVKSEPYITATDICTFRLYGELCEQEEFTVYSTALNISFTYNLINNSITIEE